MTDLLVPARYRGPASSGNGGWTAGALAGLLDHDVPADHAARWPTVQVTLRRPPPLDTPLPVVDGTASDPSGEVVASAEVVERDLHRGRGGRPRDGDDRRRVVRRPALAPVPHLLRVRHRPRGG